MKLHRSPIANRVRKEEPPLGVEKHQESNQPFPALMVLTPLSRNPIRLPVPTVEEVMARPVSGNLNRFGEVKHSRGVKKASIIIVTYNNLLFNRICLESVLANTEWANYEIIVVDNGSSDGTPEYLRAQAGQHEQIRLLFNDRNLGFAPAGNQGLALARGEFLVLLNNDTLVPRQWLKRLIRHLEKPAIGLVGPVTNRSGNETQIEVPYETYGELVAFGRDYCQAHAAEVFDIRMLAMFCVAMRRDVYKRVGPLDERFECGLFEDDDYAMRVHSSGYRVLCAEDVFVHHFGQASLGHLASAGEYGKLFHANRRRWEKKWGCAWEPYQRRRNPAYEKLLDQIRKVVRATLPSDAIVAVVSKGDAELLDLDGRRGWHFPQSEDGRYTGYHPADSEEAITQLKRLRLKGAQFLLLPQTALWWLEHYKEFGQYLETHFRVAAGHPSKCVIIDLREQPGATALPPPGATGFQ